jgi:indolepyruvate ferredoxin oxidoreductase beta subunit
VSCCIHDHFKPGVPEIAALLPRGLPNACSGDRARVQRGLELFAVPIALGTHTVFGLLALRALAALKRLRRRGARFAQEQALIERWIGAVEHGLHSHAALGHELACCGRMIKGYGATNERGKENLLHIVDHLALADGLGMPPQRASMIRAAREAALADDAGLALDQVLAHHGAPARPVPEQPIRWVRTRPAAGKTI